MIIHMNGYPGVGKLTTARALESLTGARLIDNHSLINIATMAYSHGSPEYLDLLIKITRSLYEALTTPLAPRDLIFTNALSAEYSEDVMRLEMVRKLAIDRGDIFVPILLTCDKNENKVRLTNESRVERKKLMNTMELDNIYERYTIFHPDDEAGLILDITKTSPMETALLIKRHCDNLPALSTLKPKLNLSQRP